MRLEVEDLFAYRSPDQNLAGQSVRGGISTLAELTALFATVPKRAAESTAVTWRQFKNHGY